MTLRDAGPVTGIGSQVVEWPEHRLDELHGLVTAALPQEHLTPADIRDAVFEPSVPRAVLATPDGRAAIALGAHGDSGSIDLLVVHPEHRRAGLATGLLERAFAWTAEHGCTSVSVGGRPPFYLWPGVDRTWIGALALFERCGFRRGAAVLNLSCPTACPDRRPIGARVVRAGAETAAAAVHGCDEHFPHWTAELRRAVERGRTFVAVDDSSGEVLGFACHGTSREGWFGPTATFPAGRGRGVGTALLSASLADMRRDGHDRCEISWVGPVAFYARVVDVSPGRTFIAHRRALDGG